MKQHENYNGFKQIFKFIANVISWTILLILLLIAGFLLYYFVANKIYASKGEEFSPAVGLYTIVSPSMTPNLNVYDVIVNAKVNRPEDIQIGDIITFTSTSTISKGLIVTHRVVGIAETENGIEYRTQGDNNPTPDTATVPFRNIKGKVILKLPQLGKLQQFLATSSGWLVVVVVPALFIILSDILKIFRLTGAKKKVNTALQSEAKVANREKKKKEAIRQELKRRYNLDRSSEEPDPLPTHRKLTKVTVDAPKEKENDFADTVVLPKLKTNDEKSENKPKNKKGKRRK